MPYLIKSSMLCLIMNSIFLPLVLIPIALLKTDSLIAVFVIMRYEYVIPETKNKGKCHVILLVFAKTQSQFKRNMLLT